jgi:hypothetical protein
MNSGAQPASYNAWAEQFGCDWRTVQAAVQGDPALTKWYDSRQILKKAAIRPGGAIDQVPDPKAVSDEEMAALLDLPDPVNAAEIYRLIGRRNED